eukprot:2679887-Rhodomonas_salina.1
MNAALSSNTSPVSHPAQIAAPHALTLRTAEGVKKQAASLTSSFFFLRGVTWYTRSMCWSAVTTNHTLAAAPAPAA